ncbi:MAG: hypothetical protein HYX41_02015 [Bdellovibrio sp.]|nr:hypothetical protein [Bdellovibrio sp.]
MCFGTDLLMRKRNTISHEIREDLWNGEHKGDFVASFKNGARTSDEYGSTILRKPFEDLTEGKKYLDGDIAIANDAYYHEKNTGVAVAKYSAQIAFVGVKGTYYMVVKPSAHFIEHVVVAGLAVPANVAWQGLTVGAKGLWLGVKFTTTTLGAVLVETYSVTSSGVAVILTAAATGIYKVAHFAKNIGSLPHNWNYPIRTQFQTSVKLEEVQSATEKLVQFLSEKDARYQPQTQYSAKSYSSDTTILDGTILIRAFAHHGKISVSIEARKDYQGMNQLNGQEKEAVKVRLEEKMLTLKAEFEKILGSEIVAVK